MPFWYKLKHLYCKWKSEECFNVPKRHQSGRIFVKIQGQDMQRLKVMQRRRVFHDLCEHVQTILVYGEISVLSRLGKYEMSCLDTVEISFCLGWWIFVHSPYLIEILLTITRLWFQWFFNVHPYLGKWSNLHLNLPICSWNILRFHCFDGYPSPCSRAAQRDVASGVEDTLHFGGRGQEQKWEPWLENSTQNKDFYKHNKLCWNWHFVEKPEAKCWSSFCLAGFLAFHLWSNDED